MVISEALSSRAIVLLCCPPLLYSCTRYMVYTSISGKLSQGPFENLKKKKTLIVTVPRMTGRALFACGAGWSGAEWTVESALTARFLASCHSMTRLFYCRFTGTDLRQHFNPSLGFRSFWRRPSLYRFLFFVDVFWLACPPPPLSFAGRPPFFF